MLSENELTAIADKVMGRESDDGICDSLPIYRAIADAAYVAAAKEIVRWMDQHNPDCTWAVFRHDLEKWLKWNGAM
jgi:hypothetical protein